MKPRVLTGEHFMNGDVACAEGAIAAGCKFFGGYPITPATEVAEHISVRLPHVGGTYIQMEDEIAAMTSILGGAWTGVKSMTATSGPGFSLMMETVGLAVVTETPCVVVNVQRAGPSTGLPTQGAQADMMQVRWGSHGDYEIIAIAPASPQEMFDLTITAFNLSETYRTPVFIMSDEIVGHMSEKVVIPEESRIRTVSRPKPSGRRDRFRLYKPGANGVAPMPAIGDGYNVHVTGLTHDEKGYPVMSVDTQKEMMDRLLGKIRNNLDDIIMTEGYRLEDAEIVIVSYGVSSRTSYTTVDEARKMGIRAGLLRLITVWPFPEEKIRRLAGQVKGFVTVEINMGQISREVQRCAGGQVPTYSVGHPGGAIIPPDDVIQVLREGF
ncbi:2-oxoglutarate ferredoxin oxidoreductase subunit alpha [Desulfonema ishimotonii]|uniref:2-oxoglutarate ferredoxin oxidoreductase subunit alpha n=1 Tax=Desulfonema ishimotonii TaxID=45657 RepID=A0A401FTE2_9BACT|nr:2-oxoacid:acceptor oxidoreductase subunit alpha [Desulfonema ishimotonii]GBC60247.1 2-oxoglutarate ferredoxin oxidoreductase subunit alpha [Desulfonema ishimotonii]